jgi:PhnB protein
MEVKTIPEGFHSLVPSLIVNNSVKAIEFYKQVFGAKKRSIFNLPDGSTLHAELLIGDSILMLSDEFPDMNAFSPLSPKGGTSASLLLYVDDVDTVFNKAVSAGSKVTMPLQDAFWGDRAGGIVDPFGHNWLIATHIKDMPQEELEKAMTEMFAKKS